MNHYNEKYNIVLASGSPRRIDMMKEHDFEIKIIPSKIEEALPDFLSPNEATMFLSLSKALDVASNNYYDNELDHNKSTLIIAADTVVVFNNKILGKPLNEKEAIEMLLPMSNKKHQVITGVSLMLINVDMCTPSVTKCFYESTDVVFKTLPKEEILDYVKTREPYDKAGGYAIQGTFSKYIDSFNGDLDNVIGFPWTKFIDELNKII